MNEDVFNTTLRKFLKKVGFMTLKIAPIGLSIEIDGAIELE